MNFTLYPLPPKLGKSSHYLPRGRLPYSQPRYRHTEAPPAPLSHPTSPPRRLPMAVHAHRMSLQSQAQICHTSGDPTHSHTQPKVRQAMQVTGPPNSPGLVAIRLPSLSSRTLSTKKTSQQVPCPLHRKGHGGGGSSSSPCHTPPTSSAKSKVGKSSISGPGASALPNFSVPQLPCP